MILHFETRWRKQYSAGIHLNRYSTRLAVGKSALGPTTRRPLTKQSTGVPRWSTRQAAIILLLRHGADLWGRLNAYVLIHLLPLHRRRQFQKSHLVDHYSFYGVKTCVLFFNSTFFPESFQTSKSGESDEIPPTDPPQSDETPTQGPPGFTLLLPLSHICSSPSSQTPRVIATLARAAVVARRRKRGRMKRRRKRRRTRRRRKRRRKRIRKRKRKRKREQKREGQKREGGEERRTRRRKITSESSGKRCKTIFHLIQDGHCGPLTPTHVGTRRLFAFRKGLYAWENTVYDNPEVLDAQVVDICSLIFAAHIPEEHKTMKNRHCVKALSQV